MFVDMYAGTFYSMITKYKKKHNLLLEDQAEYYFESLFLLSIQAIFCMVIQDSIDLDFSKAYVTDFTLNAVLFFTSLMLHFATIYTIRNGM